MRHYMVDPDNEERLLKIPPRVVNEIKLEAFNEAVEAVSKISREQMLSMDASAWLLRKAVLDTINSLKVVS